MGFQGGQLGASLRIWERMFDEDVTIFLGLAGAMVPAGLGEFIRLPAAGEEGGLPGEHWGQPLS